MGDRIDVWLVLIWIPGKSFCPTSTRSSSGWTHHLLVPETANVIAIETETGTETGTETDIVTVTENGNETGHGRDPITSHHLELREEMNEPTRLNLVEKCWR